MSPSVPALRLTSGWCGGRVDVIEPLSAARAARSCFRVDATLSPDALVTYASDEIRSPSERHRAPLAPASESNAAGASIDAQTDELAGQRAGWDAACDRGRSAGWRTPLLALLGAAGVGRPVARCEQVRLAFGSMTEAN